MSVYFPDIKEKLAINEKLFSTTPIVITAIIQQLSSTIKTLSIDISSNIMNKSPTVSGIE